jgi:hypothetical protein
VSQSRAGLNDACRHAYSGRSIRNIVEDDGVSPNPCMAADRYRPQDFGSRADIHMTADSGRAVPIPNTQRHLLEQQAIRADFSLRMDDDAIRVRQHQTATQSAIQRNVRAGDCAPISMPQYRADSRYRAPEATGGFVTLI